MGCFTAAAVQRPRDGRVRAVSVVSGHIRGLTNTIPLQVEILYNEYNSVAAFALAALLASLALVTLGLKTFLNGVMPTLSRTRSPPPLTALMFRHQDRGVEQDFGSYPALRDVSLDIAPANSSPAWPSAPARRRCCASSRGSTRPTAARFILATNTRPISRCRTARRFRFPELRAVQTYDGRRQHRFRLKARPRRSRPSRVAIYQRVTELLNWCSSRAWRALSGAAFGGQRQRVALARARHRAARAAARRAFWRAGRPCAQGSAPLAARNSQKDRPHTVFVTHDRTRRWNSPTASSC